MRLFLAGFLAAGRLFGVDHRANAEAPEAQLEQLAQGILELRDTNDKQKEDKDIYGKIENLNNVCEQNNRRRK